MGDEGAGPAGTDRTAKSLTGTSGGPAGPERAAALRDHETVGSGGAESAPTASRERSGDEPLARAAHELRNTVGSILASLEATLEGEGDLDPRHRRRLMIAQRNSRHLARLAEDLLLVEGGEARRLALELAPVDVTALVAECVENAQSTAEKRGIGLVALPGSALFATADAGRLAQVIDNLVSNALKFTPAPGRVVVAAEARGLEIEVCVTDTGSGIDAEDLPHLFEPFYRRPAGGLIVPGSGLGLAVCRAIVEAHGGRIWADRGPDGLGSTFSFTVPVATGAT